MNHPKKFLLLFMLLSSAVFAAKAVPVGHSWAAAGGASLPDSAPLLLADSGGSIEILAPKDGATLGGSGIQLKYNVTLSPNGNHIHVYVDDNRPIIDRDVSGCPCTLDLPDLSAGKHTVVMKEATSDHVLTGLQSAVSFTVQ